MPDLAPALDPALPPPLTSAEGAHLVYTALRGTTRLTGTRLRLAAEAEAHGYLNWPGRGPGVTPASYFATLDAACRSVAYAGDPSGEPSGEPSGGRAPVRVPILSNEGWIDRAADFARHLPQWFDGRHRIDVFAAARPPLEWLNAAYWQWGVWTGLDIDRWLDRRMMPYRLGSALRDWAALPGVRLHLHLGPDVVAGFSERFGTALPPAPSPDLPAGLTSGLASRLAAPPSNPIPTLPLPDALPGPLSGAAARPNAALPPAMVGFLLRNRRFRRTPHDSQVDFVVRRWCALPPTARLWALGPQHALALRGTLRAEVDQLLALVPDHQAEAALAARPGWRSEAPYHDLLRAPQARLHDPEDLVTLHCVLRDGAARAARAAGCALPALPAAPGVTGPHAPRDAPVARVLEILLRMDAVWRRQYSRRGT